ncbi:hypothetical protein OF83DRAFT_1173519 [Amylostereum chailletii]|nr:hypothetical protein OF83DRAFT_1173519 [Amylostereum chailletii]
MDDVPGSPRFPSTNLPSTVESSPNTMEVVLPVTITVAATVHGLGTLTEACAHVLFNLSLSDLSTEEEVNVAAHLFCLEASLNEGRRVIAAAANGLNPAVKQPSEILCLIFLECVDNFLILASDSPPIQAESLVHAILFNFFAPLNAPMLTSIHFHNTVNVHRGFDVADFLDLLSPLSSLEDLCIRGFTWTTNDSAPPHITAPIGYVTSMGLDPVLSIFYSIAFL